MNKRFCKLGNYAIRAFFFTAICGSAISCKDDYTLDDLKPSWLGSNIYNYLEDEGDYTNFVRLIDDLNYKEVLARTGSKTLFVANDEAFQTFYSNNPWGVHSYDELTNAQKRLLLNGAMINNAYLLEMMSSTTAGSGTNDLPEKGKCLRRETALSVTDSIPHLFSTDIPISYNAKEKDYWKRFRESSKGIYLALDATSPMMTHFLTAQLANNDITDNDFKILTGYTRDKNDAFIGDCKVIRQDVTCQNGYIDVLDKVYLMPQNMAEVLRTTSDTKIFSHMLDRFSAPFYNHTLTQDYRLIYGNEVDSVFEKRYFALSSQGEKLLSDAGTDPVGNPTGNAVFDENSNKPLPFDPGWNTYNAEKTNATADMAVIFCPDDAKFMNYFFNEEGGGHFLVKAYAPDYVGQIDENTTDMELVFKALDQIPRQTIRALLNNLMKESFNSSVPSKFETIKNSAQDAMFDATGNYHCDYIKKVLLASNGVIYVMNEVTTPAEYAAVSAPAYVETDKRIFNWAVQSATLGGVPTNYYAYLLAMSSRFSFFVPTDEEFLYIDPISFKGKETDATLGETTIIGRAFKYTWDGTKSVPKVASYKYYYDLATNQGTLGELVSTETISEKIFSNRLKDMLETHTIIHEDMTDITGTDETQTGVETSKAGSEKHYFVSKNGSVIYVDNATARKSGMHVKGGWQIANNQTCEVIGFDDKSAQSNGYGNGYAYMLNAPMMPTIESVYSVLYNNPEFSEFFELCLTDAEVLKEIGITSTTDQRKFNIFADNNGIPCFDKKTGKVVSSSTNVRFFNNYRYTVYVPSNSAMQAAYAAGLPTWQDLRDILQLDVEDESEKTELTDEQIAARDLKVKAMATAIINFVKYHFQDNSIFADTPVLKSTAYETATVNSETGVYCKVNITSTGNGSLSVQDVAGHTRNVVAGNKNIIARDYITKPSDNTISSTSAAVIHEIDGVLDYKKYANNRYDSDWASEAKARAYLKKYQLKK